MAKTLTRTLGVLLGALVFQASAATVTITDNEWHAFDVDDLTAVSGGLEWIDTTDGSALSFSFTLSSDAILRVVDSGWSGDTFRVLSNGSPLGITSAAVNNVTVDPLPPTQQGFDTAWADPTFSKGAYLLSAGNYSITGLLNSSATFDGSSPLNATVGAVMLAPVPEPTHALLMLAGLGIIAMRIRARRSV